MKYLKNYLEMFNIDIKPDRMTERYINDDITLLEYNNILNENMITDIVNKGINWAVQKISSMLLSIMNNISKIGTKAFDIFKSIITIIGKFKDKYPTLYKAIIITIIVIVILMVTTQSAAASNSGVDINDAAFQFLNHLTEQAKDAKDFDKIEILSDAMSYIKNLKGGVKIDVSNDAIEAANKAIKGVTNRLTSANLDDNKNSLAFIQTMAKQGAELMRGYTHLVSK